MDYEIRQEQKRKIAGFHMVGPWEHTVKQGFEQLMTWVDRQRIVPVNGLPSITTIQIRTCRKTPLRYRGVRGREFHPAGQ